MVLEANLTSRGGDPLSWSLVGWGPVLSPQPGTAHRTVCRQGDGRPAAPGKPGLLLEGFDRAAQDTLDHVGREAAVGQEARLAHPLIHVPGRVVEFAAPGLQGAFELALAQLLLGLG